MKRFHLQNDELLPNAYVAPQMVTQTATQSVALKPEYLTLLIGELEQLLNKRFLLQITAHTLAFAAVAALVYVIYHFYGVYHFNDYDHAYTFFSLKFDGIRVLGDAVIAGAATGSAACYYFAGKARIAQAKRIRAIAEIKDPRIIGALLEATQSSKGEMRQKARQPLLTLLPMLQGSDSVLLNTGQKQVLTRAMDFNDMELTLAILQALEQVGDVSAIPGVQKIAVGRGDVSRDWQIMEAAKDCLLFLQMRIEDRQAAAQLLRPAAYTANATDARQLLRATPNEEV